MKKIVLALALILMGGATLSTASAASAVPVQAGIAAIAQADSNLQLVGGWKHRKRWGWRRHNKHYGHYGRRSHGKCFYKGHWYSGWYFKKKFGWHYYNKYCGRGYHY